MQKKHIATKQAPTAIGPYSQATANESLLFTAGQIPLSPGDNTIVGTTIEAQTHQVLDNLKAVIERATSPFK